MKIVGWIRTGDKAACGGTVVEGIDNCTSYGVPYSFEGARVACRKNCVIVEGLPHVTLPNGRGFVIHGMRTSGGCPVYSTLNDIDGVGNESGEAIPLGFVPDHFGNLTDVISHIPQAYDEQFILLGGDGQPLAGVYYTAKLASGELIRGETDNTGKTQRFYTTDEHHIEIHLGHLDD